MSTQREQLRSASPAALHRAFRRTPLAGAPRGRSLFVPVMMCKLVQQLPIGPQWRYELKLDGYRAEAIKTSAGVRLISRNNKDLTAAYPEIASALRELRIRQGVLDGEIVAVDVAGKPSFQALQHLPLPARGPRPLFYFAFDLLDLEGKSLLSLPLLERKKLLTGALRHAPSIVRLADFLHGQPAVIAEEIRRQKLEGIIAKLAESRYEPDKRSGAWCKWKCSFEQEFVIGGYTSGKGKRTGFGALIVGYYDRGKLRYASKVGTGFSTRQIREIIDRAAPLRLPQSPFESIPESRGSSWSVGLSAAERRTAVWLHPKLVCRVRFTEWTRDGHLRHPAFDGLREDKDPLGVKREH